MNYYFLNLKESNKIKAKIPADEFSERFFKKIDTKLKNADYKNIKKENNLRIFKGAVFRFIWNGWNLFNPISKGEIKLKTFKNHFFIKYKIFFYEFFFLALIFSIIPALGIFDILIFRIIVFAIIWILYLGSTLLAASRLDNYFDSIINEINAEYENEKRT